MSDRDPSAEALERRLAAERPRPEPGFRAGLRRSLLDRAPVEPRGRRTRVRRARVRRARALVTAYACSGLTLLAIAAAGVAGLGPLAA